MNARLLENSTPEQFLEFRDYRKTLVQEEVTKRETKPRGPFMEDQLSLKEPRLAGLWPEMDFGEMRPQHEEEYLPHIGKDTQEMKAEKRAEEAVMKANEAPETLTLTREAGGPILDLHPEPIISNP